MKNTRSSLLAIASLAILGCSSLKLESEYKDPDRVLFHANKLLVVGITPDMAVREDFETRLREVFSGEGIETVRSIDLFDVAFTQTPQTEEELDRVEQQLLDKDFDAILLTKVVGTERHTNLAQSLGEIGAAYERFSRDYVVHQDIYFDKAYYEAPTDYYTETSLYCICVGKERSLVWRNNILISNPRNPEKAIRDYIRMISNRMEHNQVLLGTDIF
ncbi:hypothetical protein [Robiginitalea biformata]|uniref:hypothetical protein n=1 Tax=Robiginitalea biformata TaxID=252307 RepID=UPI003B5ACCD5